MSRQLALSIAVSVLAMVSFTLLGQQAGAQLAHDVRMQIPLSASIPPLAGGFRLLPVLN